MGFSTRSHERARVMLSRVGRLERFDTWAGTGPTDWEYQWAVVRIVRPPAPPGSD